MWMVILEQLVVGSIPTPGLDRGSSMAEQRCRKAYPSQILIRSNFLPFAGSASGRPSAFGADYRGSNPLPAASLVLLRDSVTW
jgi:hypothetical protein